MVDARVQQRQARTENGCGMHQMKLVAAAKSKTSSGMQSRARTIRPDFVHRAAAWVQAAVSVEAANCTAWQQALRRQGRARESAAKTGRGQPGGRRPTERADITIGETDTMQRQGICTTLLRGLRRKWRLTHKLGSRGMRGETGQAELASSSCDKAAAAGR